MNSEETKEQLQKLYSKSPKAFIEFLSKALDEQQLANFIAQLLVSKELEQELPNHLDENPNQYVSFAEASEKFKQTPNNSDDIVNNIVPINRARNKTPTPPKAKT